MTPHILGLFAGTAVKDTSSVVAAAGVFSSAALGFAVVVKLMRTLMIVPITVTLAVVEARRENTGEKMGPVRVFRLVPWFLFGCLALVALRSTGVFAASTQTALSTVSVFLIAMALAAIGMSTDLRAIRNAGFKPLALGGILSVVVAGTSLAVLAAQGLLA